MSNKVRLPRDLDPRTLRWLALDFEARSGECDVVARDLADGELQRKWAFMAGVSRSTAKRLRNLATRSQNRAAKARGGA